MFMRKIFYWLLLFVLFSSMVFGEAQVSSGAVNSNNPSVNVNPTSDFEKIVVKEHFVTKKELKDHIDAKILEYQKTTEQQIGKSIGEVEFLINSKINKFVIKLLLGVLSAVFFSGSLWYFVKTRLDRKYEAIKRVKSDLIPEPVSKVESVSNGLELAQNKPSSSELLGLLND